MNKELSDKLYADFPTVFLPPARERGGDPFRWFGFEVSDGWEPIIRDTAGQLAALSPDIHCAQVKEKFGQMRFYLTFGDDVDTATREAAWVVASQSGAKSSTTCEDCGKPGKTGNSTGLGWLRTLCEPCRAAWVESRLGKPHE